MTASAVIAADVAPEPEELLRRYLKEHQLTAREFAAKVGAHRSQIYRALKRERDPERRLAAAIERETGIPVAAWDR